MTLLNKHLLCPSVHVLISGHDKENTKNHFEYLLFHQPRLPETDKPGWMDDFLQRSFTLCIYKGSYVKPVVCDVCCHILRQHSPQRDLKATKTVSWGDESRKQSHSTNNTAILVSAVNKHGNNPPHGLYNMCNHHHEEPVVKNSAESWKYVISWRKGLRLLIWLYSYKAALKYVVSSSVVCHHNFLV